MLVTQKEKIAVNLNSSVYVTLTDHINFAIERQKQNIDFTNPLLWEIKRYYPSEFQVGCYALDLIKQRFDVQLTEDEAGFIVERHIKYTKKIKLNARRHNVKFRSIQII